MIYLTLWRKIMYISLIIVASFVAYLGFSGHLMPFIGGLGWALVALHNITTYRIAKMEDETSRKIMKLIEEEEQKQKVRELSPQQKVEE